MAISLNIKRLLRHFIPRNDNKANEKKIDFIITFGNILLTLYFSIVPLRIFSKT